MGRAALQRSRHLTSLEPRKDASSHQRLEGAGTRQGRIVPRSHQRDYSLPTPSLGASGLQKVTGHISVVLSHRFVVMCDDPWNEFSNWSLAYSHSPIHDSEPVTVIISLSSCSGALLGSDPSGPPFGGSPSGREGGVAQDDSERDPSLDTKRHTLGKEQGPLEQNQSYWGVKEGAFPSILHSQRPPNRDPQI